MPPPSHLCCRYAASVKDGSQYFVLLIITDGVISDMAQTKESIVNVRASLCLYTHHIISVLIHTPRHIISVRAAYGVLYIGDAKHHYTYSGTLRFRLVALFLAHIDQTILFGYTSYWFHVWGFFSLQEVFVCVGVETVCLIDSVLNTHTHPHAHAHMHTLLPYPVASCPSLGHLTPRFMNHVCLLSLEGKLSVWFISHLTGRLPLLCPNTHMALYSPVAQSTSA